MACNTAHVFESDIRAHIHVDFISIVDSVLDELKGTFPQAKSTGLAGTMGIFSSHLYSEPLIQSGYRLILPTNELQEELMKVIYSIKQGYIKKVIDKAEELLQWYEDQGADVLIMACTELPLVLDYMMPTIPVVDSTEALAKSVVRYALKDSVKLPT
jgi:aspartate racemase